MNVPVPSTNDTPLKQTDTGLSALHDAVPLLDILPPYAEIADLVDGILYINDLVQNKNVYLNRPWETLVNPVRSDKGYPEQDTITPFPDDFSLVHSSVERLHSLPDGDILETEFRFQYAEGEWNWFRSRERILARDANGKPTHVLGIVQNITEERRALDISEVSRARYRTLVNLLSDWLFETDISGKFTYVSPQVTETLGYEPSEVIGKNLLDFMPTEDAARTGRTLRQLAATQASYSLLECPYRNSEGEIIYLESSGTPIYDTAGNWIGFRGVMRNITERKRSEVNLANTVEHRTKIAETLQRSFLLTLPQTEFPGLQLTTQYIPASDELLVGGDFYDAFSLEDDHIALIVGDVTGKGLTAATDTAEIKYLLRSYLRETSDPQVALMRLNRQLFLRRKLDPNSPHFFVCLSVAVLDTRSGSLHFAVAGMEPPIIVRADADAHAATAEIITAGSLPLGAVPHWTLEDSDRGAYRLAPGDLLMMYSDGITEARAPTPDNTPVSAHRFFGTDRLTRALTDATTVALVAEPPLPVKNIGDAVISAVQRFSSTRQRDDICLLLARYIPERLLDRPVPSLSQEAVGLESAGENSLVSLLDSEWRYVYVSPNAQQMLGRDPIDLLGTVIWEEFPNLAGTDYEKHARTSRLTQSTIQADLEMNSRGLICRMSFTPRPDGLLEIRSTCINKKRTEDLARELDTALRERQTALREREIALREREAVLKNAEKSREWQRRFITEVISNVTEGRLHLCHRASELPPVLPPIAEPVLLTSPESLFTLRRQVESSCRTIGIPQERIHDLLLAVGEAGMNTVVHAGGGVGIIGGDRIHQRIQVRITDAGSGIAEETLHRATLERGYTTAGTLGFGFSIMYSAADRVYLLTGSMGTTVVIEQNAQPLPEPKWQL